MMISERDGLRTVWICLKWTDLGRRPAQTWHSDRKNSLRKSNGDGIIYGTAGILPFISAVLSRVAVSEKCLIKDDLRLRQTF
jgi:hypothetical protein